MSKMDSGYFYCPYIPIISADMIDTSNIDYIDLREYHDLMVIGIDAYNNRLSDYINERVHDLISYVITSDDKVRVSIKVLKPWLSNWLTNELKVDVIVNVVERRVDIQNPFGVLQVVYRIKDYQHAKLNSSDEIFEEVYKN
jgi:hypothetical protein